MELSTDIAIDGEYLSYPGFADDIYSIICAKCMHHMSYIQQMIQELADESENQGLQMMNKFMTKVMMELTPI